MMKKAAPVYAVDAISAMHRLLGLPKPEHPLISLIDFESIRHMPEDTPDSLVLNFYSIWLKKNYQGKMKYGQQYYDFDDGIMSFFAPGQIISDSTREELRHTGWWLIIHPDFLFSKPLAQHIKNYPYFSYAANEALHLSEKEESMVTAIMLYIRQEYRSIIDQFSQNVIISQIELLLNYAERYYNRQFITRKVANHQILDRVEKLISNYFAAKNGVQSGLPTVQYLSAQLHISPNYLSDVLRNLTGKSTQQHIHDQLIEKAKEQLATTGLSVSEIAYQLGFEHPQSFSKLFKRETNLSPIDFRRSFN